MKKHTGKNKNDLNAAFELLGPNWKSEPQVIRELLVLIAKDIDFAKTNEDFSAVTSTFNTGRGIGFGGCGQMFKSTQGIA